MSSDLEFPFWIVGVFFGVVAIVVTAACISERKRINALRVAEAQHQQMGLAGGPMSYPQAPGNYPQSQTPYPQAPMSYPQGQTPYPQAPVNYPQGPGQMINGQGQPNQTPHQQPYNLYPSDNFQSGPSDSPIIR
jgi:hypothetical protein